MQKWLQYLPVLYLPVYHEHVWSINLCTVNCKLNAYDVNKIA